MFPQSTSGSAPAPVTRGQLPNQGLGFTLVEVAFSLAVITGSVVVIMVLITNSLRQTQLSRDQIVAAAVASHMAENFAHGGNTDLTGPSTAGQMFNTSSRWSLTSTPTATSHSSTNIANDRLGGAFIRAMGEQQIMGVAGQFDLEHRLLGPEGMLRPLPPDIARRIDSPGDAIERHLAEGGMLYYLAPDLLEPGGLSPDAVSGGGDIQESLGRLVVMIEGHAQQGMVPMHPAYLPEQRLYPFAPVLGSEEGANWNNTLGGLINRGVSTYEGRAPSELPRRWQPFTNEAEEIDPEASHLFNRVRVPTMGNYLSANDPDNAVVDAGEYDVNEHGWEGLSGLLRPSVFQRWSETSRPILHADLSIWDDLPNLHTFGHDVKVWMRYSNDDFPPEGKSADWVQAWQDSQLIFHDLLMNHWQPIYHQTDLVWFDIPGYTRTRTRTVRTQVGVEQREVTNYVTRIDANRNRIRVPITRTVDVPIYEEAVVETYEDTVSVIDRWRGIPYPITDWSTASNEANLHYWGGAARNTDGDVHMVPASQMRTGLPDLRLRRAYRDKAMELWDTIVDVTRTIAPGNPTAEVLSVPPGIDIHPAEILALNYIAHASMQITGYKPPFSGHFNEPGETRDLIPDAGAPYRAQSRNAYPFTVWADADDKHWLVLKEPLTGEDESIPDQHLPPDIVFYDRLSDEDRATFDENWTEQEDINTFVEEVRFAYGPVLNPFPGPYAGDADLERAQYAMVNLLAYLNAYIAANPHCYIVPKPLNRQTSWDQPLYAKDMFSDYNNAHLHHPLMWGHHHALFVPHINSNANREHPQHHPFVLSHLHGISRWLSTDNTPTNIFTHTRSPASNGSGSGRWWFNTPFDYGSGARPANRQRVADRTRQIVIFSAPWQQYQDFESAPSAPVDASHFGMDAGATFAPQFTNHGHPEDRMTWANPARDATMYRWPQDDFMDEVQDGPTNFYLYDNRTADGGELDLHAHSFTNIAYTGDRSRGLIWSAMGYWGADRNGNGVWDRGELQPSQRIRANEVGRFVFYNPVMWVPIR